MTEIASNDPLDLPIGRITNKDVARYVALQLADAREEIREEAQETQETLRRWIAAYVDARVDDLRDVLDGANKRFRLEMRIWLVGAVIANAIHPSLTIVGAGVAVLGGSGILARFIHR